MILKASDGERFLVELSKREFRVTESIFSSANKTDLVDVFRQAKSTGELDAFTANAVIRNARGSGYSGSFVGMSYSEFYYTVMSDRLSAGGIGDVGKKKLKVFCRNNPPGGELASR